MFIVSNLLEIMSFKSYHTGVGLRRLVRRKMMEIMFIRDSENQVGRMDGIKANRIPHLQEGLIWVMIVLAAPAFSKDFATMSA